MSISFVTDSFIRKLNKTYRKKDKATDVLSFPMNTEGLLGDIVISLQRASIQAKSFRVTFHEEVCRLLIHGFLHLLGFDHENVSKKEAEKMRRTEKKILTKVSDSKISNVVKR